MNNSLALFINGDLGKQILIELEDIELLHTKLIVINNQEKRKKSYYEEILKIVGSRIKVIEWNNEDNSALVSYLETNSIHYAISALFGHLIGSDIIKLIKKDFINLHPSLLPFGKGADPIPWAIITNAKQGVTIHQLTPELDSGNKYLQLEIPTDIAMNSGDIYTLACELLKKSVIDFIPNWVSGNFTPADQPESTEQPRKSKDLKRLKKAFSTETGTFDEFIRRIQATHFNNGETLIFEDARGDKWKVCLQIKPLGEDQ